jgi:hypothetical protein
MRRLLALVLVLTVLTTPLQGSAAARYGNRDANNAMDMAYYLSVLEENGSFQAL